MTIGLANLAARISELDESRENLLAWAEARDYCSSSARAAGLDHRPGSAGASAFLCEDIAYFITVMERITGTGPISDVRQMPLVAANDADDLIQGCRLIGRLAASVPEIVAGPLRADAQYWVGTNGPEEAAPNSRALQQVNFIDVAHAPPGRPAAKPFGVGLFTSTGVAGTYGMWRIYLELNRGSSLFPLPWHTWAVRPRDDITVCEITSAAEWVEFVESHPASAGGFVYPDWQQVARDYDGVHVSARAIAAIQDLYFPSGSGIVAPSYWDVESTLWLRWCFVRQKLVETCHEDES